MITPLIRGICEGCNKDIRIDQRLCACYCCTKTCHFMCSSASLFHLSEAATTFSKPIWHCNNCVKYHDPLVRYNPFVEIFSSDKWKDDDPIHFGHGVEHMHEILQSCSNHESVSDYNIEQAKLELTPNFSIFFNNIDGNLSNFDALSVELKKYKSKLAVIALCETNINENHKDLYQLEGYESQYQNKISGKLKGSGLGFYISKEFIFEELPQFCSTTVHMEALFIKIANTKEEIIVGVVYRPPNGSHRQFLYEVEKVLKNCPRTMFT